MMKNIVCFFCYINFLFPIYFGSSALASEESEVTRPSVHYTQSKKDAAEIVKVVSGTKVKRFERLSIPLLGQLIQTPVYFGNSYVVPHWQAASKMVGEGESTVDGVITFQQLPYNNDIKVTINVTGLPPGKHALHIHTYGDLSEGCKSTGGQFPNNFIGNVDVKDDGSISAAFRSIYLTLFGYNGIIGRSIVIHEKPIDLNIALNAEVFSSSLQSMPDALAYQNEENYVGPVIACGVISITSNAPPTMPPQI
ncbi:superoxide dismutase [Cu-Zn] [Eurosta solidaginis]|uniref:superoxide dismutase [Cu-Zn] n=1 Tax=Eurosta solidaginis TaxID=178769 RepID=UPI00353173AB